MIKTNEVRCHRFRTLTFAALLVAFTACDADRGPPRAGETLTGKVTAVFDGDTIVVLVDQRELRIRLEGIDAPERGQPHGAQAKRALSEKIFGRTVTVEVVGTDKYGRVLAFVLTDGENVNRWLIAAGHAWHYKHFNDDPELAAAEEAARAARLGLWAEPNPIQPYHWRRSRRRSRTGGG